MEFTATESYQSWILEHNLKMNTDINLTRGSLTSNSKLYKAFAIWKKLTKFIYLAITLLGTTVNSFSQHQLAGQVLIQPLYSILIYKKSKAIVLSNTQKTLFETTFNFFFSSSTGWTSSDETIIFNHYFQPSFLFLYGTTFNSFSQHQLAGQVLIQPLLSILIYKKSKAVVLSNIRKTLFGTTANSFT